MPGILQARTLEWVAISFSTGSSLPRDQTRGSWRVRLLATPWTVAHQAPPPMGFSRQECWSRVPFPSPGVRKWQLPQQCGGSWLKTVSLPPSQPLSLDTSQTVDPFVLDAITYYVRMGTQPVYFQIYMVKVSFPPGAPMRPWQPVGLQDPCSGSGIELL